MSCEDYLDGEVTVVQGRLFPLPRMLLANFGGVTVHLHKLQLTVNFNFWSFEECYVTAQSPAALTGVTSLFQGQLSFFYQPDK